MSRNKEPMPAVLDPYFTGCFPADGAASLQIYEGEGLIGSGDLAWTAGKDGTWEAEVVSPLGQTLLRVKKGRSKLTTAGSLVARLPKVAIRSDGFLEVDGHFVGIKAAEIPCILGFHLPRAWLDGLLSLKNDANSTSIDVTENQRDITLKVTGVRQGGIEKTCSRISWSSFLGLFGTDIDWCQELGGASGTRIVRKAAIKGIQDYSLRWTDLDEP